MKDGSAHRTVSQPFTRPAPPPTTSAALTATGARPSPRERHAHHHAAQSQHRADREVDASRRSAPTSCRWPAAFPTAPGWRSCASVVTERKWRRERRRRRPPATRARRPARGTRRRHTRTPPRRRRVRCARIRTAHDNLRCSENAASAIVALGRFLAREDARHDAGREHDHAVGEGKHFGHVGGRHDDGKTAGGELAQDRVNGRAGRDVDPAGGLVAQQHAASPEQPASERHLLLIAAAQFGHRLFDGAAAHVEAADERLRCRRSRAMSIQPARVATPLEIASTSGWGAPASGATRPC